MMKPVLCKRVSAFLLLFVVVSAAESATFDTITKIREFKIDPPTLRCLGFQWYIYGDDNGDATGTLSYRRMGDPAWRDALPMLRVNREVTDYDYGAFSCENLLAGSIFNLEPDTKYEVRCVLNDPDGGVADTTVIVRTRPAPAAPKPLRILHVSPGPVKDQEKTYARPEEVVNDLKPGDLVLIHGGVYTIGPEGIRITASGTKEHPIVFRGAGDGEAVIQTEYTTTIFNLENTDHLFFENLTIRGGDRPDKTVKKPNPDSLNDTHALSHAFFAEGASWLVVQRCIILNVCMGFYSYSERSTNWYIADNVITGRNIAWYPRTANNPSHTGVNIYGRGHVVCYNRISKFRDCIAIANYGKPSADLDLQCVSIDFYNNDLSEAVDDGIESDYGCHNIRIFNNRIVNAHSGLSAQPTYGGPIYFIGNELYNMTALNLKLHNWCTGLEIFHNTMVSAISAFKSYARWQNAVIRNNLFMGASGYAIETGSPHPRTTLDYDGFNNADSERFIKWYDGKNERRYLTLRSFSNVTKQEKNGVMVDWTIFVNAAPPVEGTTYDSNFGNLSLKADGAAIDAGVALPNINDGFTGKAPDLGCYETGRPKPHYGPRNE